MKVCKFGGTSLADANQFKKVKDIILSDEERSIIVVSAPGKRNKDDIKITDSLYSIYSLILLDQNYEEIWNKIKERYEDLIYDLHLDLNLNDEFKKYEDKFKSKAITKDEIASLGEYFSAKIMANYLGFEFVDARNLIKFNRDGSLNEYATLIAIENVKIRDRKIVIPGFYGEKEDKSIVVFSRGGSDVTGSYVAKGFRANMYENWTDVSGIYRSDPKIIHDARRIDKISYDELRELSYLGASMFHEDALFPLYDYPIPLVIKNTNAPEDKGTYIQKEVLDHTHLITGVTGKKDFISLTFVKRKSADKLHVILDVLNVFENYHIPVEHIPTSIDCFSVIVSKKLFYNFYERIYEDLNRIKNIIKITEDDDIALIAVVGNNMKNQVGISGKILSTLGNENINIKMIAQTNEEISIILGISNANLEHAIKTLYYTLSYEKI